MEVIKIGNRKIYGYWDCRYCDSKGIRGDHRECPNCGRPRDESTKFYMKSKTDYVEDTNKSKFSGEPDWFCSYCNSYNPSTADNCLSCCSPRSESEANYFTMNGQRSESRSEYTYDPKTSASDFEDEVEEFPTSKATRTYSVDTKPSETAEKTVPKWINWFKNPKHIGIVGGSLAVLLLLIFVIFMLIPKKAMLNIQSYSWDRTIEIEESYISSESGWTLPSNAELKYTREEFKEYRQVLDHYERRSREVSKQVQDGYDISYSYRDNGDGSFDEIEHKTPRYKTVYEVEYYDEPIYRDEPVYATKYYYDIERWRVCDKCITNGIDRNPYWGEPQIDKGERRGQSIENYYVYAIDTNKPEEEQRVEEYTASFGIWNALPDPNQSIEVKVGIMNSITEIVDE